MRRCVSCGRATVPERQKPGPGQVKYKAKGLCKTCYKDTLPLTQPTDLTPCLGCGELMVPAGRVERLGFRQHRSKGYCTVCLDKPRTGRSGKHKNRRANAEVYT